MTSTPTRARAPRTLSAPTPPQLTTSKKCYTPFALVVVLS